MKLMLSKLASLVYPCTRRKLHRLVSIVGYAFTALAIAAVWAGKLGLSTEGKIGATLGALAAAAASWNSFRPKLEAAIDTLPIPDDDVVERASSEAVTKPTLVPPLPCDPEKGISNAATFTMLVLTALVMAVGVWAEAGTSEDLCPKNTFYVGWDAIGPDCRSVLDREVRVVSAANVAAAMAKCERACAPAAEKKEPGTKGVR